LHGGLSPGAPRGAKNGNFRNGDWTAEAIEERKWLRSLVRSFAKTGTTEWVLLLAGSAGLRIEGEGERNLPPGDQVLIAAHRAHWVTWTAKDEPTIWLAIHFP
jgi:hypothetical protein